MLVVVNLDPNGVQAGFVHVAMEPLGLDVGAAYGVDDMLSGIRFTWYGSRNFVSLDPARAPAHVFAIV